MNVAHCGIAEDVVRHPLPEVDCACLEDVDGSACVVRGQFVSHDRDVLAVETPVAARDTPPTSSGM